MLEKKEQMERGKKHSMPDFVLLVLDVAREAFNGQTQESFSR
jgi:hypothetical protein